MRKLMSFTLVLCAVALAIGCSGGHYLNQYAKVSQYRVVNVNSDIEKPADFKVESLLAIGNEHHDTLTIADFDTIKVLDAGSENSRGMLQYGPDRSASGKYPYAILSLVVGSSYKIRSLERR